MDVAHLAQAFATGMEFWIGLIGFSLAAYSVVGNDSIQTLGTFMASNERVP